MPETTASHTSSAGSSHFKPVSSAALELFHQTLPKLLVFVNEKFNLENKFLREDACCKKTDLAEDFNHKFAALLAGVLSLACFNISRTSSRGFWRNRRAGGSPGNFLNRI